MVVYVVICWVKLVNNTYQYIIYLLDTVIYMTSNGYVGQVSYILANNGEVMTRKDSLLGRLKRQLVTWDWTLQRTYRDDHGAYCVRATYRGHTFYCVAKETAHQGLASFGPSVVERAAANDAYLVEFFGEDPRLGNSYVFDADLVLEVADESRGASKKGVRTTWYELPLRYGAILGDVVSGREEPVQEVPERKKTSTRTVKGITDYA